MPQLQPDMQMLANAGPNDIVQMIADNVGYNLNAVTKNLEKARDLVIADAALPVEERQITPETMMSLAEALVGAGGFWNRIGLALNAMNEYMPEIPPEEPEEPAE